MYDFVIGSSMICEMGTNDNKVVIGEIDMHDSHYIVESIMDKIEKNYKVIVKE